MSILMAVWPGSMLEGGVQRPADNPGWWFAGHLIGGALGILAVLIANSRPALARVSAGIGALALVFVIATEPFHLLNLVTTIIPAVLLATGAFALTPAPPRVN
jgi:hypothetical protein